MPTVLRVLTALSQTALRVVYAILKSQGQLLYSHSTKQSQYLRQNFGFVCWNGNYHFQSHMTICLLSSSFSRPQIMLIITVQGHANSFYFGSSRLTEARSRGNDQLEVSGTAGPPAHGLLNSLTFTGLTEHLCAQPSISCSCADSYRLLFIYCSNFSWVPRGSTSALHIPQELLLPWPALLPCIIIPSQFRIDWEWHTTAGRREKADRKIALLRGWAQI